MGVFLGRRPISRKMSRPWNRELGWSLQMRQKVQKSVSQYQLLGLSSIQSLSVRPRSILWSYNRVVLENVINYTTVQYSAWHHTCQPACWMAGQCSACSTVETRCLTETARRFLSLSSVANKVPPYRWAKQLHSSCKFSLHKNCQKQQQKTVHFIHRLKSNKRSK